MRARLTSLVLFVAAIALWKFIRPDVVLVLYHAFQGLTAEALILHGGLIRGNGAEVHTPGLTVLLPALLIVLWAKRPFAWAYLWALIFGLTLVGLLLFALVLRDVPLSAGALTFLQLYLIRPLSMGIPLWLLFGDRLTTRSREQNATG